MLIACAFAVSPRATADPPTDPVVERMLAWAARAVETLASVVCEERYVQTLRQQRFALGRVTPVVDSQTRTLRSDYLLVRFPETLGWVPFRDVYEVDGRPVRDREDRLMRILSEPHPDRFVQAERIRDESARFNLGPGTYDINVPTFALQFLLPDVAVRFRFRPAGSARVDGVETAVVEFREEGHPTIIRGAATEDVPASGRFWVTPSDGRVVQTRLETHSGGKETRIDVRYARDEKVDAWVPSEMREHHATAGFSLECRATYEHYRRFAVNTVEQIK
jgi:hypothetical protein